MTYQIRDAEGDDFDHKTFATKQEVFDFLITVYHYDMDEDERTRISQCTDPVEKCLATFLKNAELTLITT